MKVAVTGSSGKAGRAVLAELRAHDHDVFAIDLQGDAVRADVTDFGQTVEVLAGVDAVVHLAAIPAPGLSSEETTFRANITSTFNVFEAARILDLTRVVWASSETILGLPFEREQPAYAPLDEEHPPRPESGYALSKLLGEEVARQFSRWTGKPAVSLRFSNIMEPGDYAAFPSYWDDPRARSWNLWGYVDARDVGRSCRLALEAELEGAEHFLIAAGDTVMNRPSAELVAEVYPSVRYAPTGGEFDSLISSAKAGRLLGYVPEHSWRAHV